MTGDEFLARHAASEHPYLEAVHTAVALGQCQPDSAYSPVNCEELLRTYRLRAANLRRFHTPHAVELCREVVHFCDRLAVSLTANAQFHGFRVTRSVHYVFVERTDTFELLGAMRTVSKLDVSADEWQRLWGDARP